MFQPHDAIWGSNVPDDFKHSSTIGKVTLSLLPWFRVGKLLLRVETLDFRFQLFVNASITILQGLNKEVAAAQLMTLQYRYVLDLLTAAKGGVCAMVGTACCIFIPDKSNNNTDAFHVVARLRDAMAKGLKIRG